MTYEVSIDPRSGALRISELAVTLTARQSKAEVKELLASFVRGGHDHHNGYSWLHFGDFTFGGHPCVLALCFLEDHLVQVHWSVSLPGAPMEVGWPGRTAIDQEVQFVRQVLTAQLGRSPDLATFSWGQVWSRFDPKGFLASNGLRYK